MNESEQPTSKPHPEVIEGRGQAGRPGVYAIYNSHGQRIDVKSVYPGWKFASGWLYRFLCELPPETIEIPKPAFVAPEKPEQPKWELVRRMTGKIVWAIHTMNGWTADNGDWIGENCGQRIDPTTGEPMPPMPNPAK